MIQHRTMLKVADNTGAVLVQCIKVLGGTRRRWAQLGDIIVVSARFERGRGEARREEGGAAENSKEKGGLASGGGAPEKFLPPSGWLLPPV